MNRELKFREFIDTRMRYFNIGQQVRSGFVAINRLPIMQFTGLKDKNGKEIYEGDIIRTLWKEIIGEKYNKPQIKECPSLHPDYFHWYAELDDMEVEVIGNIYENPELLERQE